MCRAAQEIGARAHYVSILTGTTKSRFSRIRNSMILRTPKLLWRPAHQGRLHTKFEENRVKRFQDMTEQTFSFFLRFFLLPRLFAHLKNRCSSKTCTLIQLKFGTLVGHIKAIISINFGGRRTTARNGLSPKKAFRNLIQQLSICLWKYNAKTVLRYWALHPVVEEAI